MEKLNKLSIRKNTIVFFNQTAIAEKQTKSSGTVLTGILTEIFK